MNIGRVLDAYRKENKLTLRQLSAEIGIDHPGLHRMMAGMPCDLKNSMKLISWLFGLNKKGV